MRSLGLGRDGAPALWHALLDQVGPSGTVLVPTLSYATITAAHPRFDARTTPSCVGAFPEWVRQQDGVVRSVHPTHSVAGWGRDAADFLSDHEKDRTPAGTNSPFRRLRDAGGFILMVGCGLLPNTSMHGVEELSEPPYLFSHETPFQCTRADGSSFSGEYRCHGHFDQHYDRVQGLLDEGELRRGQMGNAESYLIDARALWSRADEAIRSEARYFERPDPVARDRQ